VTLATTRLKVSTPTEPIAPGRGFYQLEEDALYVQIGLFDPDFRFFSYLESESVHLELDRNARLIFIEVTQPRRHWEVSDDLMFPSVVEMADLRWLDFRESIHEPRLTANYSRTLLRVEYSTSSATRNYYLTRNVVAQVDSADHLAAIWINDIEDDLAGREIAAFRKRCRRGLAGTA
jgi:hypothetical protein